jgi:hypothetical protein
VPSVAVSAKCTLEPFGGSAICAAADACRKARAGRNSAAAAPQSRTKKIRRCIGFAVLTSLDTIAATVAPVPARLRQAQALLAHHGLARSRHYICQGSNASFRHGVRHPYQRTSSSRPHWPGSCHEGLLHRAANSIAKRSPCQRIAWTTRAPQPIALAVCRLAPRNGTQTLLRRTASLNHVGCYVYLVPIVEPIARRLSVGVFCCRPFDRRIEEMEAPPSLSSLCVLIAESGT